MVRDPNLDRLVEILRPYGPQKIILFGSRARGEGDEQSDYDIVVIKRTEAPFLDRLAAMVPYRLAFGRAVDILVYTPEEFERMAEQGLGWVIRQEGITVYEERAA